MSDSVKYKLYILLLFSAVLFYGQTARANPQLTGHLVNEPVFNGRFFA